MDSAGAVYVYRALSNLHHECKAAAGNMYGLTFNKRLHYPSGGSLGATLTDGEGS